MNRRLYNNRETNRFQKNMVEKSSTVTSFFCMRADPNPPSMKTSESAIKTKTIPNNPKSFGDNNLARTTFVLKEMTIVPNRWTELHSILVIVLCLSVFFSIISYHQIDWR